MSTLILIYHKLFKDNEYDNETYSVKESIFEKQMKYLSEKAIQSCDIEEINEDTISKFNSALITFDDGNFSDYEIAFPILKKYGLKGTFFITANWVGKEGYLEWDHINEMRNDGMSIQSHGLNHYSLADLSEEELKTELLYSKEMIENKIGTSVKYFAVPGGFHNKKVFRMAEALQYRGACTSVPGFIAERIIKHKFRIYNRFVITSKTDFSTFKNIVNFDRTIEFHYKYGYIAKSIVRKLIGNKNYQKLWEMFCKEI